VFKNYKFVLSHSRSYLRGALLAAGLACIVYVFTFIVEANLALPLFLLLAGLVLTFVFFVYKPGYAAILLTLELILGGNGHWWHVPGTSITPRYVFFVMFLLGYVIHKIFKREDRLPRILFSWPLLIFGAIIAGAVIHAVISDNAEPYQEAQAWLYLLLYPIIVDLWRRRGIPLSILRAVVWSTLAMAIFQLVLTLLLNINGNISNILHDNTPLEAMRVTMPGTMLRYVFWGNSSLCGIVLAMALLVVRIGRGEIEIIPAPLMWGIAVIMSLAMIFSMTRSTWAQLVLTFMLVGLDFLVNRNMPWRLVAVTVVIVIGIIWLFSGAPFVREALENRFETLLLDRSALDAGDSLVLKKTEQDQLLAAIAANPSFGYGFGLGNYAEFGGELVEDNRTRFHNYFLGFALKTGVVGLLSLLFLLFGGCLHAVRVGILVSRDLPEQRNVLFGMAYGFAGVFLASVSNPHLGTPAVIVTFAFMLATADLVFYQRRDRKENEA